MNISPKNHPNASAAGNAGALATLLIWAEGFWVSLPPEVAAAEATLVIAFALAVGRILSGTADETPTV